MAQYSTRIKQTFPLLFTVLTFLGATLHFFLPRGFVFNDLASRGYPPAGAKRFSENSHEPYIGVSNHLTIDFELSQYNPC